MNPHEIYEKLTVGEPLTDAEIRAGTKFFENLADKLAQCGPVFIQCNIASIGFNVGKPGFAESRKRARNQLKRLQK